jgi:hypothetical protein
MKKIVYRPIRWWDIHGRRCLTFVPWWRTRRVVSKRPEFSHFFVYDEESS